LRVSKIKQNKRSMQIIPSILEPRAQHYVDQIIRLTPYLSHFQIDIADGILVPNKTAPLQQILLSLTNLQSPTTNRFSFDFHLMVSDPISHIDYIKALKSHIQLDTIFIHYQALSSNAPFSYFINKYSVLAQIGLVLNPEDEVNTINSVTPLKTIPIIQIMTIHPGKQGNPFIIESLNKIGQLRYLGYRTKIAVDGGVNLETVQLMISRKQIPDIICPGSYFSKAENLEKRIEEMNKVILSY